MRITELSIQRFDLDLAQPYSIAYEKIEHSTNLVLHVKTDVGGEGYGIAAPDRHVTGETPEGVIQTAETALFPYLEGKDPLCIARIVHDLKVQGINKPSVLAMVDIALHDLLARAAGIPLYKLLGGFRDRIPTSVTIGILPLDETLNRARDWIRQGFTILKIKGGLNVEGDIERMIRLRELLGGDVTLRFDANQGYSLKDAIHFVEATQPVGLQLFEQPTRKDDDALLGTVTRQVPVPVMADESLKSLTDVYRLARDQLIDMVNIKLMKTGGLLEALHINSVAKAAGLEAMVGCMDECALGISAGLHLALSRPNIEFADLDGHLDLVKDPFRDLFQLVDGMLIPSDAPGLGPL